MTRAAFENAITVLMALGGSTNAVIHLIAIAGRAGHPADARRFRLHLAPHGLHRQREAVGRVSDGGFVSRRRRARGDESDSGSAARRCETVNGKTIGENISGASPLNDTVIRPLDRALYPEGGIAVLRRQSCAEWRGDQADRRIAAFAAASRAALTFSKPAMRCSRRSIATICRWIATPCW